MGLRQWFSARSSVQKSSRVAPLFVWGNPKGHPISTPRRYDALAEEGYHRNVIVYRCVNLIARGVSSVPWIVYEGEHEQETHPCLTLLNAPSPKHAGSAFIEHVVSSWLLSGNAYIEAVLNNAGKPEELYILRPDRVRVVPGARGVPDAYDYEVNGRSLRLPVDPVTGHSSVLHLKTYHPLNDWYGMSPLEAASPAIDQHNAVGEHNLSLLRNGGRPSGALFLKTPQGQRLSDDQRTTLRRDLEDVYEGSKNAGRILMLEGSMEWKEMALSPKDLDFVSGKNLSAREIAQAFGVPPMLVGIGDATFANYKEARYHLWEDTILPLLEFLATEFTLWLAPFYGASLRIGYDTDGIPALSHRREALWSRIASAPFLTLNEKRTALGYGPYPGGDEILGKGKA